MATDKPRFSLTLDDDTFNSVIEYQLRHGLSTKSRAIQALVESGLQDYMGEWKTKKAPVTSDEALQIAKRYDGLDKYGKTVVNVVLTEEEKRVKAERKKARSKKNEGASFAGEETARVIPLYLTPPAAGYASPVFGEDFEYIEVGGDVPAHADYAVKVDGDSMEPYIMNGATIYVNRDPLANGDVGIFFYDGDMLCKQYYRDEWGNVWLLSMNRDRADADRFVEADSGLTLVCHGRVILPYPLRLAVPENELL